MTKQTVTTRAQVILKLLIETYILKGQPVASQYLAKHSKLALSAATVRNILSELEAMGLLCAPHTSAGRIPTQQGLRFFVNTLLQVKDMDAGLIAHCAQELKSRSTQQQLVQATSKLLADITCLAGMVSMPHVEQTKLRHIEFLPLANQRILVILVINQREVQNRIIECSRTFTAQELEQMSNYLCAEFAGVDLSEIRTRLLAELKADKDLMNSLMQTAIRVAEQAIQNPEKEFEYVVTGQQHLINLVDDNGIQNLRQVFNAFTEKQKILCLFDKCLQAEGLQIFIGQEAGFADFANCSVVAAPYTIDGQAVGVLGVVGPTRMAYEQIIPIVDITAKLLSSALN
jgi:heat-inducible transcriptional repressor